MIIVSASKFLLVSECNIAFGRYRKYSWLMRHRDLPILFGSKIFWKSSTYVFKCACVCLFMFAHKCYFLAQGIECAILVVSSLILRHVVTVTWSFTGHCCAPDSHCHRKGLIFIVLKCIIFCDKNNFFVQIKKLFMCNFSMLLGQQVICNLCCPLLVGCF